MIKTIDHFNDKYEFLSNFYPAEVLYGDLYYLSVEHAFQAAKTFDSLERRLIRTASTPGKAKRLGRSATLRPDWEKVKVQVMHDLLEYKFNPDEHPDLWDKLLDTGDAFLIEGNAHGDSYWGCTWVAGEWYGENHLGKLLMEVRTAYQNELAENAREEKKYER